MYLSHTRLLRTACSRICAPLRSVLGMCHRHIAPSKGQNFSCRQACVEVPAFFPLVISLIPGCSALRAPATFKSIRNPLIFLRKMAAYSCFWRAKRSKLLLQASLRRSSGLFPLVLCKQWLDLFKQHAVRLDLILISDHTHGTRLQDCFCDRCKGTNIFHGRV